MAFWRSAFKYYINYLILQGSEGNHNEAQYVPQPLNTNTSAAQFQREGKEKALQFSYRVIWK